MLSSNLLDLIFAASPVYILFAAHRLRIFSLLAGKEITADETKREVTPHLFAMAMNNLGMLGEAEALADVLDLSAYRTMIDVGCGF